MVNPYPRDRRGFTLIELLAVVLILGILVSVALPSYMNASRSARYSVADGNARALANVLQSIAVRSGSYAASLDDSGVVNDLGGAIPNNPCSASAGAAGYTYTSMAGGVLIRANKDACMGYSPTTFSLNL